MNKAYNPIDWKNEPNTSTPINETNLNKMDRAIDTIDNRVIDLDNGKVNKEEGKSLVSNTDIFKIGANETAIQAHISDKSNPHSVTKAQVGLGNVNNTSDADKPISNEQQAKFDAINNKIDSNVNTINNNLFDVKANMSHNIPRTIPKDITSYYNDGTIWKRLNGTDGFSKYEDIFVGDYFKMSRAISAYNQDQNYQLTGSDWVTIAGISTLLGNGDTGISYEHLVMVPGKGFGGTQHFGRSRMNPTNTTVGGYVGSEMHTTTIGEVVSSGSTATTATINQQLYAEFGSHLKTTRELLSNSLNPTGYNRFGEAGGCSNSWGWYDCQAVLMSEIELYGSIVWSSSGYDTGTAKMQLPLFANNRQAMNNRSSWYWLKDVASASFFCGCGSRGDAGCYSAGNVYYYVRPRFVIAA